MSVSKLPQPASSWHIAVAQMQATLEAATSIPELKGVRDTAEAFRYAVRKAGYALTVQDQFAELRLRAERHAGETLELLRPGRKPKRSHDATPSGLHLKKSDSSRRLGREVCSRSRSVCARRIGGDERR